MRTIIVILLILLIVGAGIGLMALSNVKNLNTNSRSDGGAGEENSATSVSIVNHSFNPQNLIVPAGTEVAFTNNDSAEHTVTADDNSFDSGVLGQGEVFKHVFSSSGVISYHCKIHPEMKGRVTVVQQ